MSPQEERRVLDLPPVERESHAPIWFQIMRILESQITNGNWSTRSSLPSENDLRRHFGVSRSSVREALARLESSGFIDRSQGKRAQVAAFQSPSAWMLPSAPSLLGEYSTSGTSALTSEILRAGVESLPPWASAALGSAENSVRRGFVLERVRSIDGRVAVHVMNYMPARFEGLIPELREPNASLYYSMKRVAGTKVGRTHRTVEAAVADSKMASLLQVEVGHPIVVVEAVSYSRNGEPVDFSLATVRTDRMRVTVDTVFEQPMDAPSTGTLAHPGDQTRSIASTKLHFVEAANRRVHRTYRSDQ